MHNLDHSLKSNETQLRFSAVCLCNAQSQIEMRGFSVSEVTAFTIGRGDDGGIRQDKAA